MHSPPESHELDQVGSRGRILVVDDEKNIRKTLAMVLAGEGYSIETAEDGDVAEEVLSRTPPDLILLDVRLPKRDGLALLKIWHVQYPNMPIILMSGEATVTEALEGLSSGAYDFVEKPFLKPRMLNTITRALEKRRLELDRRSKDDDAIIGQAESLQAVLADIKKIAPMKTRILITGESGTGKDLIARAIHRLSARSKGPFVKVNCAAIPQDLIESELFGHVKGAFTGAANARRGLFEAASGGTLFMDEIGELSANAQAKILRAIQNGEISPVGSEVTLKVDTRIITATNRDLREEVELGNFREDLYYRLAVVCIESPPLRSRKTDIPLLARYFVDQIALENGLAPKSIKQDAMDALCRYPWPGNIRELRNVVERLVILAGPVIEIGDLPVEIKDYDGERGSHPGRGTPDKPFEPMTWEDFKHSSERNFLIQMLRHAGGNISEAARLLQVERSTIHKWLKSHQIDKHHYIV